MKTNEQNSEASQNSESSSWGTFFRDNAVKIATGVGTAAVTLAGIAIKGYVQSKISKGPFSNSTSYGFFDAGNNSTYRGCQSYGHDMDFANTGQNTTYEDCTASRS